MYLLQVADYDGNQHNFIGDESETGSRIRMCFPHAKAIYIFRVMMGNIKQLYIHRMNTKDGSISGFVTDFYDNLEFSFTERR